jgi:hypothetical protein
MMILLAMDVSFPFRNNGQLADTAKTSVVNAVSYTAFAAAATTIARRVAAPSHRLKALTRAPRRAVALAARTPQLHIETKISPLETVCMRAALDRLPPSPSAGKHQAPLAGRA